MATYDSAANGGEGEWIALGTSLATNGISGTGAADHAEIFETLSGPVVAWLDRSSGTAQVYVRQFDGASWQPLGVGAANGGGVSNAPGDVGELALTSDGSKVAVAWTQEVGGVRQVYVKEYVAGTWNELDGSATAGGVSDAPADSAAPSLAYLGGSLFAAWQSRPGEGSLPYSQWQISAAHFVDGQWSQVDFDVTHDTEIHQSDVQATAPMLASSGGQLYLAWIATNLRDASASRLTTLDVRRWDGMAFAQELPGDAGFGGVHQTAGNLTAASLAVDPAGRPVAAWQDSATGAPEVYVRANPFDVASVYFVNDASASGDQYAHALGSPANDGLTPSTPKSSVQDVLDTYTLIPGDVILVDAGAYSGFSVDSSDAGFLIQGAWGGDSVTSGAVVVDGADGVTLTQLDMQGGLSLSASTNTKVYDSESNSLVVTGASDVLVEGCIIAQTFTLSGGTTRFEARYSEFEKVRIDAGGASEFAVAQEHDLQRR